MMLTWNLVQQFVPTEIGGRGAQIPEDLETYGDLGLRIPFSLQLRAFSENLTCPVVSPFSSSSSNNNKNNSCSSTNLTTIPTPYRTSLELRRSDLREIYTELFFPSTSSSSSSAEGRPRAVYQGPQKCAHRKCVRNCVDFALVDGIYAPGPRMWRWCDEDLGVERAGWVRGKVGGGSRMSSRGAGGEEGMGGKKGEGVVMGSKASIPVGFEDLTGTHQSSESLVSLQEEGREADYEFSEEDLSALILKQQQQQPLPLQLQLQLQLEALQKQHQNLVQQQGQQQQILQQQQTLQEQGQEQLPFNFSIDPSLEFMNFPVVTQEKSIFLSTATTAAAPTTSTTTVGVGIGTEEEGVFDFDFDSSEFLGAGVDFGMDLDL
jgi:hypothetical protein